jgi:hypothetical protein
MTQSSGRFSAVGGHSALIAGEPLGAGQWRVGPGKPDMNARQLMSLGRQLRSLVRHADNTFSYFHSLQLISQLTDCRDWKELISSPEREHAVALADRDLAQLARQITEETGAKIALSAIRSALSGPKPIATPILWPDGPAPGVYVTTSWVAIEAAVDRYRAATGGASVYADIDRIRGPKAVYLGPSEYTGELAFTPQSRRKAEFSGIFSRQLAHLPGGTLITVGSVHLAEFDIFHSADVLHEACCLALERAYRTLVLVRTPRQEVLWHDLLLALDREPYFDRTYVEPALRGVIEQDGRLTRLAPLCAPRPPPIASARPGARAEVLPELASLLAKGIERRRYGFLILGGDPGGSERSDLFAAALAATERAGPVALILPSYNQRPAGEWIQMIAADDGAGITRSKSFPQVPMFSSIESAYASGYRRIAVESECWPFPPVRYEAVHRYADEVCFLLCVDHVDAEDAFAWAVNPRGDWTRLDQVIAVLCCGKMATKPVVSLCDAFVPGDNPVDPSGYEEPWDALRDHRQLRWEYQALRLLESGQVSGRQVRKYLHLRKLLDPENDLEAEEQIRTEEGLHTWLAEEGAPRRKPSAGPPD